MRELTYAQALNEALHEEMARDDTVWVLGEDIGTRPVAELMYLDFVGLAMDQIVNQAAKLRYMFGGKARVPMVLRAQEGAGRGNAAQHSQSLEAWFCHIPGLKVVTPSTPSDAKGLLKSVIRDDNPVIFLEHKV